jgi:hypothetical protein
MTKQGNGELAGSPRAAIAQKRKRAASTITRIDQENWCAIYDGRTCIGHAIARGRHGVEAYDVDDKSIGTFVTIADAANALEERGRP